MNTPSECQLCHMNIIIRVTLFDREWHIVYTSVKTIGGKEITTVATSADEPPQFEPVLAHLNSVGYAITAVASPIFGSETYVFTKQ